MKEMQLIIICSTCKSVVLFWMQQTMSGCWSQMEGCSPVSPWMGKTMVPLWYRSPSRCLRPGLRLVMKLWRTQQS